MGEIARLYAVDVIEKDIASFLSCGLLTPGDLNTVQEASHELCRSLGVLAHELVSAFGIPEGLVTAPIAKDWAAHYSFPQVLSKL